MILKPWDVFRVRRIDRTGINRRKRQGWPVPHKLRHCPMLLSPVTTSPEAWWSSAIIEASPKLTFFSTTRTVKPPTQHLQCKAPCTGCLKQSYPSRSLILLGGKEHLIILHPSPTSFIVLLLRQAGVEPGARKALFLTSSCQTTSPRAFLRSFKTHISTQSACLQPCAPGANVMWNDEDNNPYGDDFDRRDSFTSSITNSASPNECMCHFSSLNHLLTISSAWLQCSIMCPLACQVILILTGTG